jgi:two-component system, cell cycle response regulator DivK
MDVGEATGVGVIKVLVVEDDLDAAQNVVTGLRMLGYECRRAHDGLAALELVEEFCPNVILMDVTMPRMNGFEATRRIRARTNCPDPVVVCFTSWTGERAESTARQAGCDAHVAKQDGLHHVDEIIRRLLAARRQTSVS